MKHQILDNNLTKQNKTQNTVEIEENLGFA